MSAKKYRTPAPRTLRMGNSRDCRSVAKNLFGFEFSEVVPLESSSNHLVDLSGKYGEGHTVYYHVSCLFAVGSADGETHSMAVDWDFESLDRMDRAVVLRATLDGEQVLPAPPQEELAGAVASLSRDVDPYGFDDEFEGPHEAEWSVARALMEDPEAVAEALEAMAQEAPEEWERSRAAALAGAVRDLPGKAPERTNLQWRVQVENPTGVSGKVRWTRAGADRLADRLRREGRHGTVYESWWEETPGGAPQLFEEAVRRF